MDEHVFPEFTNGTTRGANEGFGLTKRELFAAMAMQGLLAKGGGGDPEAFAMWAVRDADALLAELAKEAPDEG